MVFSYSHTVYNILLQSPLVVENVKIDCDKTIIIEIVLHNRPDITVISNKCKKALLIETEDSMGLIPKRYQIPLKTRYNFW